MGTRIWQSDLSNMEKEKQSAHHVWHVDETYIKVKGEWCYLYRAIDSDGYTLDFQLRKHAIIKLHMPL